MERKADIREQELYLIEEARDLKENGFGEASSGRCFFKGRLSSTQHTSLKIEKNGRH